MNQERFDDLTRALATTQVSRLQVLKTLVGSAVIGLTPLWLLGGTRRASTQVAQEACPIPPPVRNFVIGSCQCFIDTWKKWGVESRKYDIRTGQFEEWTHEERAHAATVPSTKMNDELISQTCYDPKTAENISCDTANPKNGICVRQIYKVTITSSYELFELSWEPDPPALNQSLCNDALREYHSYIRNHEQGHIDILESEVKKFNNDPKYQNFDVSGCGKDLEDAQNKARGMLRLQADATYRNWVRFVNQLQEDYHQDLTKKNQWLYEEEGIEALLCVPCQPSPCDPPCGPCESCEAVVDPVGGTNFKCTKIQSAQSCGGGTTGEGTTGGTTGEGTTGETTGTTGETTGTTGETTGTTGETTGTTGETTGTTGETTGTTGGTCPEGRQPCGGACCGSCQVCDGGQCRNCNQCEECQGGACVAIDCGSPCLECREGACFPKECGPCETCDPQTGQCVSTCGPCQECGSDGCVNTCGPCQTCNSQTGACDPVECGPCQKCDEATGVCRSCIDSQGSGCCGGTCCAPNEGCCGGADRGVCCPRTLPGECPDPYVPCGWACVGPCDTPQGQVCLPGPPYVCPGSTG